jgi:hypothetical protein
MKLKEMFCPRCGKDLKIHSQENCYSDDRGIYYICKSCHFVFKESIKHIKNFRHEIITIYGISFSKEEQEKKSINDLIKGLEE